MPRPLDPSRDLLFGLLALQTGLINQAQLVAAFHAWTQAADRPMAEILAEQGALSAPCVALVEGLVIEHLRRHGDEPGRSLAAIDVGPSTREGLARIGDPRLDASLARVGADATDRDGDPDRTATYSVGTASSDGQRFRVLRPHAHGGLGAVFVALDAELHREVALKQILDHHADDPIHRRRFLIEAEITGRLEHPGVVPVYGLGTHGDGRPYYAMRFIRGDSLKQAIERFHADGRLREDPGGRSLELRNLLRRFTDVCNAIEYAHSRGVLHRDIKPGNIVIGKYGETLVVDWGLAKAVGRPDPVAAPDERTLVPSSSSGLAETMPGSALGTPAYMSPEQARGDIDRLGPRSDVYALGATLYCLLTGRAPFLGDDAGTILRQVQAGEFRPPRALDPSIDRALEAVCLRAMAMKPEDRYATPRALADDVERWMADEPVSAWREPLSRRVRRWAWRNRTVVATATAALLVALIGTATVLAVQTEANRRLSKANTDLRASNEALAAANARVGQANADLTAANERVAARFDLALEAIRLFHGEVSEDLLLKEKPFEALRTRLLRGAAEFYRRLEGLVKPDDDRASRAALGRAYEALGEVIAEIGSRTEELAIHRRALAVRRALAAEPGANPALVGDVARSLLKVADAQRATGDTSGAMSSLRESLAIYEALARDDPAATPFQLGAAKSHHNIGYLLSWIGRPAEALDAYRKARVIYESLGRAVPPLAEVQRDLARTYNNIGRMLDDIGRAAEALDAYEKARDIQQSRMQADPAAVDPRYDLALTLNNIGVLLSQNGRSAEALTAYEKARDIQRELVRANPAVTRFQSMLALDENNIGTVLPDLGRPAEALAAYERARGIQQSLADANPAVAEFQNDLARTHHNIGLILSGTGRPAEALAAYEKARDIQQELVRANPAVTPFRSDLAAIHSNLGVLLYQTGRTAEALREYEQARAIGQQLAAADPDVTRFRADLARSHNEIGALLKESGRPEEALEAYAAARTLLQALVGANPDASQFRHMLANVNTNIGILLKEAGRPAEALASHAAAQAILRGLTESNPASTAFQISRINNDLETGDVLRLTGRPAEARAAYEEALAAIEGLMKAEPAFAGPLQVFLVFDLKGLGATQQADGRAADAVASWRRALATDERIRTSHGETLYYLAGCHARLGGIAGTSGSGLSAAEGAAELDRAMDLLRRAVAGGYSSATWMRRDPDLDMLRARPDFRALLADLVFPSDPFANETDADRRRYPSPPKNDAATP